MTPQGGGGVEGDTRTVGTFVILKPLIADQRLHPNVIHLARKLRTNQTDTERRSRGARVWTDASTEASDPSVPCGGTSPRFAQGGQHSFDSLSYGGGTRDVSTPKRRSWGGEPKS